MDPACSSGSESADHANHLAQKLKRSCDRCRALKIRCGGQKPLCNRCRTLGLSCNYSSAQRVGRPPGRRRRSRQALRSSHAGNRSLQPQPKSFGGLGQNQSNIEPINNLLIQTENMDLHYIGSKALLDNVRDGYNYSDSMHPLSYVDLATIGAAPCSSWLRLVPDAVDHSFYFNSPSLDCSSVIAHMQQRMKALSIALNMAMFKEGYENALASTNATCKQLSSNLTCSCSEQMDIGLLIAATFLSILDVYYTIISQLSNFHTLPITEPARLVPMDIATDLYTGTLDKERRVAMQDHIVQPDQNELSFELSSADSMVVGVVEELSKFSAIVEKFTFRYSHSSNVGCLNVVLGTLILYLQSRVQEVMYLAIGKLLRMNPASDIL